MSIGVFSIRANVRLPSSLDLHQASFHLHLLLFNYSLRFNPFQFFLGLPSIMGPSKECFSLYKTFIGQVLSYASPGWFPFLSVSNITKLERLHLAASHAIIGCLFFPIPIFLLEVRSLSASHPDSFRPVIL